MRKTKITKLIIVFVLFVLSAISLRCLDYRQSEQHSNKDSDSRGAVDSISILKDTLGKWKCNLDTELGIAIARKEKNDSVAKSGTVTDSVAFVRDMCEVDSIIDVIKVKKNCAEYVSAIIGGDTIEGKTLDSISSQLKMLTNKSKDRLKSYKRRIEEIELLIEQDNGNDDSVALLARERNRIEKEIRREECVEGRRIEECTNFLIRKSAELNQAGGEWSIGTISFDKNALFQVAFVLVLVLSLGMLCLLKKKRNVKDDEKLVIPSNNEGGANLTDVGKPVSGVTFESPKPMLSYEICPTDDLTEGVLIKIQSNVADTEIFYCFSEERDKRERYLSPLEIRRACLILAKGVCAGRESDQLEINVDLSEIKKPGRRDSPSAGTKVVIHGGEDDNVNSSYGTDLPITDPSGGEAKNPKSSQPVDAKRVRVFTNSPADILGISYQGDNHVRTLPRIPCQDYHSFSKVNDVWNVAIVSDGAGSKEHSDIGSKAVCAAFTFYLSRLLESSKHFASGDIPCEKIWDLEFRAMLAKFQSELKSKDMFKSYDFGSYAATIVILAYSPKGCLFAHVGDGRAGVKVNGEWKSILTPHKGEEANQTIFSTTVEFASKPALMMSGVFVPETKVIEGRLEAFVLMSDGCEGGAWSTYQKVDLPNGDFKVEDVNKPRSQTLNDLMTILDCEPTVQQSKLVDFITGYNKGFKTEGDDKTILIGRVK